jgi:hypothetical protein
MPWPKCGPGLPTDTDLGETVGFGLSPDSDAIGQALAALLNEGYPAPATDGPGCGSAPQLPGETAKTPGPRCRGLRACDQWGRGGGFGGGLGLRCRS